MIGIVLTAFIFSSCVSAGEKAQPKLETKIIYITNREGKEIPLRAEMAKTNDERQKGLMFRKKLAGGEAMLFIFERDQILSFWMKNTILPLSIAFISHDKNIIDIYDMEAQSLQSIRSSRSARYALEVPQGWFEQTGITEGCAVKWSEL